MAIDTSTIGDDVQDHEFSAGDEDLDSAAEALLKRWHPDAGKQPSETTTKETTERARNEETDEHEAEENDETETDEARKDEEDHESEERQDEDDDKTVETESKQAETKLASDDHEVEVTVDGEKRRVSVKDLTRLYGQEASLTRKSQEVAAARQKAEETANRHGTALQTLVKRAEDKWKPFAEIDWLVASQNLPKDEFTSLRQQAQAAWNDVSFYRKELDQHAQDQQNERNKQLANAATECVKVLTDPEKGIKGWNQQMYDDLRSFSVEQGMDVRAYNTLTDPAAFKIINMAYQYAKAQKVAVNKVTKAPKNVVGKSKTTGTGTTPQRAASRKAMEKLRSSGELDDAADAFLSRWGADA